MPRGSSLLSLALILWVATVPAAVAQDAEPAPALEPDAAAPEPSDDALAQDAIVRHLVWRAADAPDEEFEAALDELEDVPELTWRTVAQVIRDGREYDPGLRGWAAELDPSTVQAHFANRSFPGDRVEILRIADDELPFWYACHLPAAHDGRTPLAVWLELGGSYVGRHGAVLPDDWAVVEVNPTTISLSDLGGTPLSVTAGRLGQSLVLSIVADLERRFPVDRDRLFVGGFSRFGNATWYLAGHWPDRFAGVVPAAGFYPPATDVLPNFEHLHVLAAHGGDRGHRDANAFTESFGRRLRERYEERVQLHESEDRAIGESVDLAVIRWARGVERDPLPDRVSYVLTEPVHRGAYWVAIDEVRTPGTSRFVEIRSMARFEPERIEFLGRPARITAERSSASEVHVTTRNVSAFTLHLSDTEFELDAPIVVRRGERRSEYVPRPSVRTLLVNFRRDRDDRRLFPAELRIR